MLAYIFKSNFERTYPGEILQLKVLLTDCEHDEGSKRKYLKNLYI